MNRRGSGSYAAGRTDTFPRGAFTGPGVPTVAVVAPELDVHTREQVVARARELGPVEA